MPQLKVGCKRDTHPCTGRQHLLLNLLPLDLHVLGLPLAFILSQDQTLHCNYKKLSCSRSITLLPKKEFSVAFDLFTFSIFSKNYLFNFLWTAKLINFFINTIYFFNFLLLKELAFESGCKGKPSFLISKSFCKNFQIFFPSFQRKTFVQSGCKDKGFLFTYANKFSFIFLPCFDSVFVRTFPCLGLQI